MSQSGDGRAGIEEKEERNDDRSGPQAGDLAKMMLPEFMGEEREQGDRQENAEKRQCPGKGEFGSVQIGCVGGVRKEQKEEQNNEGKSAHSTLAPRSGERVGA